jgi:hypothetical protein
MVAEILSADFDSYIYLLDANCNVLSEDDNSGVGNLSQVTGTLPYSGVYTVVVTTAQPSTLGNFELSISPNGPVTPPPTSCALGSCCFTDTVTVSFPDVYTDDLTTSDATGGPRGAGFYFDDIEVYLQGGTIVTIEHNAPVLDSYLFVADENCTVIASDNDGGSGQYDSLIVFTVPSDGVYTIIPTTYGAGETGQYTIEIY